MAIGNLFDNREKPPRGGGFHYEWRGDVSFREEDIKYLVQQFKSGIKEPELFVSGKSKTGKGGHYVTLMLRKPKENNEYPEENNEPPQPVVEEPSPVNEVSLDDIPF